MCEENKLHFKEMKKHFLIKLAKNLNLGVSHNFVF